MSGKLRSCQEGFKEFVRGVFRVVRNFQERCQESCDESLKLEVSGKFKSCQEGFKEFVRGVQSFKEVFRKVVRRVLRRVEKRGAWKVDKFPRRF